jgi:hypothetical protein
MYVFALLMGHELVAHARVDGDEVVFADSLVAGVAQLLVSVCPFCR